MITTFAIIAGLIVGLIVGAVGWFVGAMFGLELLGFVIGLCLGDVATMLLLRDHGGTV